MKIAFHWFRQIHMNNVYIDNNILNIGTFVIAEIRVNRYRGRRWRGAFFVLWKCIEEPSARLLPHLVDKQIKNNVTFFSANEVFQRSLI